MRKTSYVAAVAVLLVTGAAFGRWGLSVVRNSFFHQLKTSHPENYALPANLVPVSLNNSANGGYMTLRIPELGGVVLRRKMHGRSGHLGGDYSPRDFVWTGEAGGFRYTVCQTGLTRGDRWAVLVADSSGAQVQRYQRPDGALSLNTSGGMAGVTLQTGPGAPLAPPDSTFTPGTR